MGVSRDELLDILAGVLRRGALERFLVAPLIQYNETHFPDPWSEDLLGVRTVLRRMLIHVGLPQYDVEIDDERTGESDGVEHGVHFVDVEGASLCFAVTAIPPPRFLVKMVALEVTRAWLAATKVVEATNAPYRAEDDDPPTVADDGVASVAMFALGLGVLAVGGSAEIVKSESVEGGYAVGQWQQVRVGGLPPKLAAFLLAAQLAVRDCDADELKTILAPLSDDHRVVVVAEVQTHRKDKERLVQRLGVPPSEQWPEPSPVDTQPLTDDSQGDGEVRERDDAYQDAQRQPNRGAIVFRVRRTHTLGGVVAGAVLGGIAAAVAPISGAAAVAVVAASVVGVGLLGSRTEHSRCSDRDCEYRLRDEDRVCPRCGGTVGGEIASANERLEALERYEDKHGPSKADSASHGK